MAPVHATPVAVIIPHGIDNMIDPPPISSHSRQPEWLRRHAPSDFVPPSLLSSLALDASRENNTGYPTSCITGTRLDDVCLLLSAAGPARDLISLTQIPLSSIPTSPPPPAFQGNSNITGRNPTINAAILAEIASSGYKPWYTRAHAPLVQLALNFPSREGWSRFSSSSSPPGKFSSASNSTSFSSVSGNEMEVPIVAARSASSVEFWKLEQQQQQQQQQRQQQQEVEDKDEEEDSEEEEDGNRSRVRDRDASSNTRWKLREESLGVVDLSSLSSTLPTSSSTINCTTTADLAWCHHLTTRCTVLCRNGILLDIAVEDGYGSSGKRTSTITTNANKNRNRNQNFIPAPIGWAPSQQLLSELPFLEAPSSSSSTNRSSISLRCAFTDNHPRHVVVSLHSRLGYVDLRGGGGGGGGSGGLYSATNSCYRSGFSLEIYRCAPGQWISALATPCLNSFASASVIPSSSLSLSFPSSCSHYVAASTATEILIFDLRRPHAVLASWEHSMTAEGKVKTVDALYAAPPDTLSWLPPVGSCSGLDRSRRDNGGVGIGGRGGGGAGGASTSAAAGAAAASSSSSPPFKISQLENSYQLIASNSSHGKAIVCEWNEHRTRGGIAAAKKGKLWEYSLSNISKLTSKNGHHGGEERLLDNDEEKEEDDEDIDEDDLRNAEFSFEPACWTEIKPEQPPKLLFNLKIGYPVSLMAAVDKGKDLQRHRKATLTASTRAISRETAEGEVREGGDGDGEGNATLQQQQQQQQQQLQKRVVKLLPSGSSGPAFLGISVIPLQHSWTKSNNKAPTTNSARNARAGVSLEDRGDRGQGGSGSGKKGIEAVLAMLSHTQEIILAELGESNLPNTNSISNNNIISTSTAAAPAAVPAVLHIVNPIEPERIREPIDPGGVEEIKLDFQGRIMEDPQITLAKEAAAAAAALVPQMASKTATPAATVVKITTNPQYKIKQPVYVGLSLHKWMLEEAIRQFEMTPEEYQATFPFPPREEEKDQQETEEASSLRNKIQSLKLTSARVPFTAGEIWTALTCPTSQERTSRVFQGMVPYVHGLSKKKRTASASASGNADGGRGRRTAGKDEINSAKEIFTAALTRAGVIPLPPHIRAIPGRESNSTGLSALHSRAPFFPPSPSLSSFIIEQSTHDNNITTYDAEDEMETEVLPSTLRISTLKYRKQQFKSFAPALSDRTETADEAPAGEGSSQDHQASLVEFQRANGIQPPEVVSEEDGNSINVVFTPVVQHTGAEEGIFMHVCVPGKPPSAAAQAILDELKQGWTGIE